MYTTKNRSISFKLTLFITFFGSLIFLTAFGYNYFQSMKIIEEDMHQNIENFTNATVNKVDTVLSSVQKIPQNLKFIIESKNLNEDELLNLLKAVVEGNDEIYGAAVAFEPYAFDNLSLYFAPYFYKKNGKIEFTNLGADDYRYFYMDWYQIPKELKSSQWSEPYFDKAAGNIVMSTYSIPFYKVENGKEIFMGVITADVSLEWLQNIVSSIKILKTGYGTLISKNGTFITHPSKELIMNDTIFSSAEALGDNNLREIGRKMIHGETGISEYQNIYGQPSYMYYTPIKSNGWCLSVFFPINELKEDIIILNRNIFIVGVVGILLLLLITIVISRSITKPLRLVAKAAVDIGSGDINAYIPSINSDDEVGKLTKSFHYMRDSLIKYISDLKETTAAKERIESELQIARQIQMSLLPKIFPPFLKGPDNIDMYAIIQPAKEVGGDFYDFFFIDDTHFCFIIGDVSGKGIPASLFMGVTKTLLKTKASDNLNPSYILTKVNNDLCSGNDNYMFVTIFCAVMNTKTGEVIYSNGGHNPPFIIRRDNSTVELKGTDGVALGVMEDALYATESIFLKDGDSIFMYTDGVTEAMNSTDQLFSEKRVVDIIEELSKAEPKEIIEVVMDRILSFADGTPQSDDITIMVVKFKG